jgi:RNA polymerase sigma factor (sigma-70 family)
MFPDPKGICRINRIEFDDLLQYARTGLWKGCLSYKSEKGTKFITHAISNVKYHVIERLNRETSMIRYSCNRDYDSSEIYGIVSMDGELNDSDNNHYTYHDVISDSCTSVESDVIGEITGESLWDKLNSQQKEIIKLLEQGMSYKQIGDMWNMTGENVKFKIKNARKKIENLGGYKFKNTEKNINRSLGRRVSIEGKIYNRIMDASKELNVKQNTICDRLKSNSSRFREWYYVN